MKIEKYSIFDLKIVKAIPPKDEADRLPFFVYVKKLASSMKSGYLMENEGRYTEYVGVSIPIKMIFRMFLYIK